MKKIYLVNFPTKQHGFGAELKQALIETGVVAELSDADDFLMDLGNGLDIPPKLLLAGAEVDTRGALFFMKQRKPHKMYSSLLLQFVSLVGGDHLNPAFKEHHKNVDKQSQYINLVAHGYAIPRTVLAYGNAISSHGEYIRQSFQFPLVMKASGSCGKQVWKVNDFDEIEGLLQRVSEERKETVVLQEFIEQSQSEYRAIMCCGDVQAVVVRSSESFYNNYAQGGIVSKGELSAAEVETCKEIAAISGLDYLGVDFFRLPDGRLLFMELQTGPSLKVSKMVAPHIIAGIADSLKKRLH